MALGRRMGSVEPPQQPPASQAEPRAVRAVDAPALGAAPPPQRTASPFAASAASQMPSLAAPPAPIAKSWDNSGGFRLESANSRDLSQLVRCSTHVHMCL